MVPSARPSFECEKGVVGDMLRGTVSRHRWDRGDRPRSPKATVSKIINLIIKLVSLLLVMLLCT